MLAGATSSSPSPSACVIMSSSSAPQNGVDDDEDDAAQRLLPGRRPPAGAMAGRRRVRREIRTLSEAQRGAYFAALRAMRSTPMEIGRRRFGPAYRSHAYLLLKHATSALHPCVDQGHDMENQMTFHRALLLEVEASILAVVAQVAPNATLDALPYWDFATDIAQTGNWWSGSLWKYWGSPFGDPDNEFCIEDPVFETLVERGRVPELQPLVNEIFGPDDDGRDFVMGNGHGFWRSPWNQGTCPGLTRNPGWVLGAPTSIGSTFRACQEAANYTAFMVCIQGRGFTRLGPDIGPHNSPHVSMGTFNDDGVGSAVFESMLAFLALGVLATTCMSTVCMSKLHAEYKGTEMTWPSRWSWLAVLLVSLSFVGCLAAPAVHEAIVGVPGAALHVRWLRETFARQSIDFKGTEWRSGELSCPASGSCAAGSACACTKNRYACGFHGADFWDGAFSLNENYFYSIHAFTDLLHLRWAATRKEPLTYENAFGGFPRAGRCPGMAFLDDISEEFCFSGSDVGLADLRGSGQELTPEHAANSGEPCLTHADILALSEGDVALPYTYDVLEEAAVWRPIEPTQTCTVERACAREITVGASAGSQSVGPDALAWRGDFVCLPSEEVLSTNFSVVPLPREGAASACVIPKPLDVPERKCSCKAETFRAHAVDVRDKAQKSRPPRVARAQTLGASALAAAAVILLAKAANACYQRRQIRYSPLEAPTAIVELESVAPSAAASLT